MKRIKAHKWMKNTTPRCAHRSPASERAGYPGEELVAEHTFHITLYSLLALSRRWPHDVVIVVVVETGIDIYIFFCYLALGGGC